MNAIWIAIVICAIIVLSGALPLLRDRHNQRAPLPPRPASGAKSGNNGQNEETLKSWRTKD